MFAFQIPMFTLKRAPFYKINPIFDCVKNGIAYPHFQHVVLYCSDYDENEKTSQRNFSQDPLRVPVDALDHAVVDRRVEQVVFGQDKLERSI